MATSIGQYRWPPSVQGAAVAPTAAQAAFSNSVKADIIATADADTTLVITHNLGFSATELTNGVCEVLIEGILANANLSAWCTTTKAANATTVAKTTAVGSGNAAAQATVTIRRAHTIIF